MRINYYCTEIVLTRYNPIVSFDEKRRRGLGDVDKLAFDAAGDKAGERPIEDDDEERRRKRRRRENR